MCQSSEDSHCSGNDNIIHSKPNLKIELSSRDQILSKERELLILPGQTGQHEWGTMTGASEQFKR